MVVAKAIDEDPLSACTSQLSTLNLLLTIYSNTLISQLQPLHLYDYLTTINLTITLT